MEEFNFSFLLPTRGRPESLPGLCDSIRAHTSHPDQLEIVFVMDNDDAASLEGSAAQVAEFDLDLVD